MNEDRELAEYFYSIFGMLDTKHAHLMGKEGEFSPDYCDKMAAKVKEIMSNHGWVKVQ